MKSDDARAMAERLLADELPRRWSHVIAVAAKAEVVADHLGVPADLLVSAAWLHDVGYASRLAGTGFHPLDGARWLRTQQVDERIVALVAHHSCASVEAGVRGLAADLRAEFPPEPGVLLDALAFCDMTTGPDGQAFPVAERLTEIRSRYGAGHPVTLFIDRAEPSIRSAVDRIEELLARRGRPVS
ncbi:MAG: HDIG domain-containing metalloprotein [Sporichthyaceae bacterium]